MIKYKGVITVIILVSFLLTSTVTAKQIFDNAEDVANNAEETMIIINLINSSQDDLERKYNLSKGNFTLKEINLQRAIQLNNPNYWIWVNETFFEIVPLLRLDRNTVITILFENRPAILEGQAFPFIRPLHFSELKVIIDVNKSFIDQNYPDNFVFTNIHFFDGFYSYKAVYSENNERYELIEIVKYSGDEDKYPGDSYIINFSILAVNEVLIESSQTEGQKVFKPQRRVPLDIQGQYLVWGKLKENKTIEKSIEEGFDLIVEFQEFNLIVKKQRNNGWRYTLAIFGLVIYLAYLIEYINRFGERDFTFRKMKELKSIISTGLFGVLLVVAYDNINLWSTPSIRPFIFGILYIILLLVYRYLKVKGGMNGRRN